MTVIFAPNHIPFRSGKTVFLAGSIESGQAENWQDRITPVLVEAGWTVLNPRRLDWDWTWEQVITNDKFREQVEWELSALEIADRIILYLSPGTKSPISLLEYGLFARSNKMVVVCPEGFWRKGNVDIVAKRYGITTAKSLEEAAANLSISWEPSRR